MNGMSGSGGIKKKLIKIGNGDSSISRTFSAKSISGYEKLTVNDFVIEATSVGIYDGGADGSDISTAGLSKSYNQNTGELSVSSAYTAAYGAYWHSWVRGDLGYNVYVLA